MTEIVGKCLAGIVGTSVKPLTNMVFNKLKFNTAINQYQSILENNKALSESVIENIKLTIENTFDRKSKETVEKLISTMANHDEFVNYLVSSNASLDKYSEEYNIYINIIKCLVEDMYQLENLKNLIICFSETEREILLFNGQNNILKQLGDSNRQISKQISDIKNLIEAYNLINQGLTLSKGNKIVDDNEEFIGQYKDSLFLEANINDDDYAANLESVYVEPKCTGSSPLSNKLKSWRNQSKEILSRHTKVLLLYGKAGIGKSSLTSYIIEKKILGEECHALVLRKNENVNLLNHRNAWESVKQCFKCDDDDTYKNKVLILDGLDEVCVLKKNFNGKLFVENLRDVSPRGVKILITSRNHEGYFEEIESDNNLEIENIVWTSDEINQWCKKYCEVHKDNLRIKNWCKNFIKQYEALDSVDKRKDIFCTPIILYICCAKEIDISKHDSVAGIYDEAFHYIGNREHGKTGRTNDLKENDEEQFKINWQYTKELAFQMFLNDSLESALSGTFINKAHERTAELLEKENTEIKPQLAKYFAVFHFVSKNNEGIEFAHKTVGEYFTAVKIYEDYIKNISIESTPNKTWENIFQAFRYKKIPEDIMIYLVELIKIRLYIELENWRNKFFEDYYIGMDEQLLWKMTNQETYYKSVDDYIITEQVAVSFRNLTWLLSLLAFKNNDERDYSVYKKNFSSFFLRNFNMDINCMNWMNLNNVNLIGVDLAWAIFSGADLEGAQLMGANLSGAQLTRTNLQSAYLEIANMKVTKMENANLGGANMNKAELEGASMIGAYLNKTYLSRANLKGAKLMGAHLKEAHLSGAKLMGAHLEETHLEYAHLEYADLTGAHLNESYLIGAHLTEANISLSDLTKANMTGAYLKESNVTETNLTRTNLMEINFNKAILVLLKLFEEDLPQFDENIKKYGVKLIDPKIICVPEHAGYVYDPKTNRMIPPGDKIESNDKV